MSTRYGPFMGGEEPTPLEALAGTAGLPDANQAPPSIGRRRRKAPGERWEDRHVRRTFHLPRQVSDALDEAVRADEDLSLAAAATEAFEAWLRRRKAAARKPTTPTTPEVP